MKDDAKIQRFRDALAAAPFDAVVAISPENTWYLSEAIITTQRELLERISLVVWGKDAEPIYIVCTNEEVQARKESWIEDIRGYVEYRKSPIELLADALNDLGAAKGKVGIEKRFMNVHYYELMKRLLPDVETAAADEFFDTVRAIKTPDEIRILEQSWLATDRCVRTAFSGAVAGKSDKQLSAALTSGLLLGGATIEMFQVLAAGPDSESTHPHARNYVLKSGDLIRTDIGGLYEKGYCTDLARTMCVGRPTQKQRDIYRRLWEEHERLIDMLRPGQVCREIFLSHKQSWEKKDWPMVRPHIGHGLGIGEHEYPLLRPGDNTVLQPGMCLTVEPNHFEPGIGKYHVEDLVLVTERGPRLLSHSADWSQLFTADAVPD
jgi:Xaa-Pro aminopeptidase